VTTARRPKQGWGLESGDVVAEGRRIVAPLGGGSDYEVYAGVDDALGPVVLKIVRPNLVSSERTARRLRREFDLLTSLRHPNIVRSLDVVSAGPRPHLVLERIDGPSLRNLLRDGPIAPEKVLEFGTRLASAIASLAQHGVVHLDVKPSNVVAGPPVTLIDFSVARTFGDAKKLDRAVGTDIWMSPEQCEPQQRGPVGPAADVWGLGATLWRALLGKAPFRRPRGFDRGDPMQRFPQLTSEPRPLPDGVPPGLATLLRNCLSLDPSDRPSATELAAALSNSAQPVPA
jgi:serine/threonine protein kinase